MPTAGNGVGPSGLFPSSAHLSLRQVVQAGRSMMTKGAVAFAGSAAGMGAPGALASVLGSAALGSNALGSAATGTRKGAVPVGVIVAGETEGVPKVGD